MNMILRQEGCLTHLVLNVGKGSRVALARGTRVVAGDGMAEEAEEDRVTRGAGRDIPVGVLVPENRTDCLPLALVVGPPGDGAADESGECPEVPKPRKDAMLEPDVGR
jgi:hypothetical protein